MTILGIQCIWGSVSVSTPTHRTFVSNDELDIFPFLHFRHNTRLASKVCYDNYT